MPDFGKLTDDGLLALYNAVNEEVACRLAQFVRQAQDDPAAAMAGVRFLARANEGSIGAERFQADCQFKEAIAAAPLNGSEEEFGAFLLEHPELLDTDDERKAA